MGVFVRTCLACLAVLLVLALPGLAGPAAAQSGPGANTTAKPTREAVLRPIRTDSPRDTLQSFLLISRALSDAILRYRTDKSPALTRDLALLSEKAVALIDLSAVPVAARRERGEETVMVLLDIFGRISAPDLAQIPDVDAVADREGAVSWRVPRTPIRISLVEAGPRQGEFLFNARTVQDAPRFLSGIADQPLTPRMPFKSWTAMSREITGPLIPSGLAQAVPVSLRALWMDTPAWKVVLTILVYALVALLILLLFLLLRWIEPKDRLSRLLVRLLVPAAVLFAAMMLVPAIARNINLSGQAANTEQVVRTIAMYIAWAWVFWLAIRTIFEVAIKSPSISDESFDANMLRLISGILGVTGVILILAFGGQQLGLPVLSLLAGLGIGGLAVALAIRPTLENLIGGFVLYIDKPVRVGDFCNFGGQKGTIESIGVRSTQIRALDRTLITVPNAQFADMQLINWARCDQMLIEETVGVRYETTTDQLRFVLAEMRAMLHSHPRIDPHTVRVRFIGYGDSALNIGIRVYAKTREWNDFFAIREDVFLRIYDIVTRAGSGFAFPSQTVYFSRDDGLDAAARDAAEQQVQTWRRSGRLPFPRLPEQQQEKLEGTLDYPPRGSYEASGEDFEATAGSERLSSEPDEEAPSDPEKEKTVKS